MGSRRARNGGLSCLGPLLSLSSLLPSSSISATSRHWIASLLHIYVSIEANLCKVRPRHDEAASTQLDWNDYLLREVGQWIPLPSSTSLRVTEQAHTHTKGYQGHLFPSQSFQQANMHVALVALLATEGLIILLAAAGYVCAQVQVPNSFKVGDAVLAVSIAYAFNKLSNSS